MRPFISTNLAISADGKISDVARQPSRWTSEADHARLKSLREKADALMVGRGTWEKDRMMLNGPRNPLRCVVSRRGVFAPDHPMFAVPGGGIHLLVTSGGEASSLVGLPADATLHEGSLEGFLEVLARDHGVGHVHCEGGGELVRALAELDFVDEFHLTWAGHTLFGGHRSPTPTGLPGEFLPASRWYELTAFEPHGVECFLTYRRKR